MSQNRVFPCIGFLAGVIAVIFAIVLLAHPAVSGLPTGEHTSYSYYGGDAYTGIQQAGADAARNVKTLTEMAQAGFAGINTGLAALLLVLGLALIAHFGGLLFAPHQRKTAQASAPAVPAEPIAPAAPVTPVAPEQAPTASEE